MEFLEFFLFAGLAFWIFSILVAFSINLSSIMRQYGRQVKMWGPTLGFMLLLSLLLAGITARLILMAG